MSHSRKGGISSCRDTVARFDGRSEQQVERLLVRRRGGAVGVLTLGRRLGVRFWDIATKPGFLDTAEHPEQSQRELDQLQGRRGP